MLTQQFMKYIVNLKTKTYKKLIECKYCKYYRDAYNDWDVCSLYDLPRLEHDFCSRAKKKDDFKYRKKKGRK